MRATFLLTFAFLVTGLSAADWPCWHGPDGLGVSTEKNLPSEWSKEKNIAWKIALPGKGASSPVIVGSRVYVTTQTPDTGLHVLAIDRDKGAILWDREIGRGKLSANNLHNMATPTPVSDGKSIWALFGTGDLAALDQEGKILWQRNLVTEYGKFKLLHGYGSSPMLLENRIFIACMHQGPSWFLAIDATTGKDLWKKDRTLEPKDEAQDSYSSPIFLRKGRDVQVVLAGAETINAYDPKTGAELWNANGMKVPHHAGRTIAGPTAGEGMVINVASGFQNRGYTVAFKTGGKGDISQSQKAWTQERFSSDCPTPVIYQGKLFTIRDDGNASCLNLKTGEPFWQERLFSENVKVSPVAADGRIYFTSGQANCYVVNASEKFSLIATNRLNEFTLSTPAISAGRIFIRTEGNLYCVQK
jgi:outer membrane protein assembly factor BamB